MSPDLGDLQRRLSGIVGGDQVREGKAAAGFSVDGVTPSLVVHAGSQEEVEAVVVACGKAGAAVVPWGGGTAIGIGNPPSRLDVVVCVDRLARIVELDEANLNVSAEAGVRLADLQTVLARKQEFLPLHPPRADRVTVGGLVAANSSGPTRLQYGTARDWVLGLRVVLPDGARIRCGGKVVKNVSGYDMNKLFIGSLGTLGVVTEATFKLLPVPSVRVTIVGLFRELSQAAAVVARTLESQLLPEALDALDSQALGAVASALGLADPSGYGLAIAVAGSRETVERQVRDFTRLFARSHAIGTTTLGGAQGAAAWQAIGDVQARMGVTSEESVVVKIAVPIGNTLHLLSSAERLARRNGWRGAVTAHAGSGIVRAGYLVEGATLESLRDGLRALRGEAESADGSLVVETAPTALKRSLDAWGKPPEAAAVMRRLKVEFDPRGLLSPGRFLAGI